MAYEFPKLIGKLKDKGLDLAEESAKVLEVSVFEWLKESAAETPNPIDDMVVAAAESYGKPELDKAIDKIDGHEG